MSHGAPIILCYPGGRTSAFIGVTAPTAEEEVHQ